MEGMGTDDKEQEIIDFLSEKYDATEQEVIEAINVADVNLEELADYRNAGDRVNKSAGGLSNITTQRPKADIEEVIKDLCPTVIQLLDIK